MFCMLKREKICPAHDSKHKLNRAKQIILLMILSGKKTMALSCSQKTIELLLGAIISKHHVIFIV